MSTIVNFTSGDGCWVDTYPFIIIQNKFITIQRNQGFPHIALYYSNGTFIQYLTTGDFHVDQIKGVSLASGVIYYTSTELQSGQPANPLRRYIWSVDLNGKKTKISIFDGWNSVDVSPSGQYYVQTNENSIMPPTYTLKSFTNPIIEKVLENNTALNNLLASVHLPTKQFITLQIASNITLNAYVLFPPGYDANSNRKFPVLMNVYGGPGSQTVFDRFALGIGAYISSLGYIYASVDGRGTGFRGNNFEKVVYQQLGIIETQDQVAAAKELQKLSYIDGSRIGIFGASYGGFMVANCMTDQSGVFGLGVSVAPVTDWRFYDSVYTERYMLTPLLNPTGYANTSVLTKVANIKKPFFLIHGTGDDNVHFLNSVELSEAMIEANIYYRAMYYPNRDHSITGNNARQHYYQNVVNFLQDTFPSTL